MACLLWFLTCHAPSCSSTLSSRRWTGPEVYRELRNATQTRDMPVIMITGADDSESVDSEYAVGATDFVSKPVPWSVLIRRIRFVIRARVTVAGLTNI